MESVWLSVASQIYVCSYNSQLW